MREGGRERERKRENVSTCNGEGSRRGVEIDGDEERSKKTG